MREIMSLESYLSHHSVVPIIIKQNKIGYEILNGDTMTFKIRSITSPCRESEMLKCFRYNHSIIILDPKISLKEILEYCKEYRNISKIFIFDTAYYDMRANMDQYYHDYLEFKNDNKDLKLPRIWHNVSNYKNHYFYYMNTVSLSFHIRMPLNPLFIRDYHITVENNPETFFRFDSSLVNVIHTAQSHFHADIKIVFKEERIKR